MRYIKIYENFDNPTENETDDYFLDLLESGECRKSGSKYCFFYTFRDFNVYTRARAKLDNHKFSYETYETKFWWYIFTPSKNIIDYITDAFNAIEPYEHYHKPLNIICYGSKKNPHLYYHLDSGNCHFSYLFWHSLEKFKISDSQVKMILRLYVTKYLKLECNDLKYNDMTMIVPSTCRYDGPKVETYL